MVTKLGQFQWVTTAMGLVRAPASFQRLIEMVVYGLPNVLVYINDLLLHSASHEEHQGQLDTLLTQLRPCGIKINLLKCELGSKEVVYLVFCLTKSGILPGHKKLQEVRKTSLLSTVHQVW